MIVTLVNLIRSRVNERQGSTPGRGLLASQQYTAAASSLASDASVRGSVMWTKEQQLFRNRSGLQNTPGLLWYPVLQTEELGSWTQTAPAGLLSPYCVSQSTKTLFFFKKRKPLCTLIYLACMIILPACMACIPGVCLVPVESEEGAACPGTGVMDKNLL